MLRERRRLTALAFGGPLLALSMTSVAAQAAPATPAKVTICHATSSAKNPYVTITVSVASVGGGGKGDHLLHANDIIPPVNGHGGLNWDAAGTAIYAAGCRPAALRDSDQDGVTNPVDEDDDGDGIADIVDEDDDGDGIADAADPDTQLESDQDADGIPDGLDPDDDNDGITDERDRSVPPRGTRPPVDSDRDGIDDGRDFDDDGDCALDSVDTDRDGNGVPDDDQPDTDLDGIADALDLDDDGDLIPDFLDDDADGNGVVDDLEQTRGKRLAGREGAASACATSGATLTPNQTTDLDGDGIPNATDPDDDNDGIPDAADADQDGDGIPNATDADDDGDGVDDLRDEDRAIKDNPRRTDADRDGIPDLVDADLDGDGIPNGKDDDADADGNPETIRATLAAGFELPAEVRDGEVTLLLPAGATTAQGRPVQVTVRCIQAPAASTVQPRSLTLGDVAPVDVTKKSCRTRQRSAGVVLDLQVDQPTTVIVTVQAPPTADARALARETRYHAG